MSFMQIRRLAFGTVAACFALAIVLAALNGTVQGVALQAAQHLPAAALSTEGEGNVTIPGGENGLVTALGGIALVAAFLVIMLVITLRKRKKKGL